MRFFELAQNEDQSFQITLIEKHPIFQAHFPDYPILPGACTGEIIRKATEIHLGKRVRIVEVKQLKFIQVISLPEDKEFTLTLSLTSKEEGTSLCKAILKKEAKTFCKAELIVKVTDNE